jgi:hypothetical protein
MKVTNKTYVIKTYSVTGGCSKYETIQVIQASPTNLRRYLCNIAKSRENDNFRIDVEATISDQLFRVTRDNGVITMNRVMGKNDSPANHEDEPIVLECSDCGDIDFSVIPRDEYNGANAHTLKDCVDANPGWKSADRFLLWLATQEAKYAK